MRNLNCHIRHICHTAVYALELQRVAMVTDSVTDTVTDFCQSCTYATASFYMHDVGSFTQWNSLFRPVEQFIPICKDRLYHALELMVSIRKTHCSKWCNTLYHSI